MYKTLILLLVGILPATTTKADEDSQIAKLIAGVTSAQHQVAVSGDRIAQLKEEIAELDVSTIGFHEKILAAADSAQRAYNRKERLDLMRKIDRTHRYLEQNAKDIHRRQRYLAMAEARSATALIEMEMARSRLATSMGVDLEAVPSTMIHIAPRTPAPAPHLQPEVTTEPPVPIRITPKQPRPAPAIINKQPKTAPAIPPTLKTTPVIQPTISSITATTIQAVPLTPTARIIEARPVTPVEPKIVQAQPVIVEPKIVQAQPVIIEPKIVQAQPVIIEPKIVQAQSIIVEPKIVQAQPVIVEPKIVQAQPVIVEPEIVQAQPVIVEPEIVQAQPVIVEPEIVQAQPVIVEPKAVAPATIAVGKLFFPIDPVQPQKIKNEEVEAPAIADQPDADVPAVSLVEAVSITDAVEVAVVRAQSVIPKTELSEPTPTQKYFSTYVPKVKTKGFDNLTSLDDFDNVKTWAIDPSGSKSKLKFKDNTMGVAYRISQPAPKDKAIIGRLMHKNLSTFDALVIDIEQKSASPARVAVAFRTRDKLYYESTTFTLKPGMNKNVEFDLTIDNFKSGKSGWLHTASLRDVTKITKFLFLIYAGGEGTTTFSDFRARPTQWTQ
jgi:hypothetical protein